MQMQTEETARLTCATQRAALYSFMNAQRQLHAEETARLTRAAQRALLLQGRALATVHVGAARQRKPRGAISKPGTRVRGRIAIGTC